MTARDRTILRDLAKRVAELASLPIQEEKRQVWYGVNDLKPIRPAILCFGDGSWEELIPDTSLVCESSEARGIERNLKMHIYAAEHFYDDQVCDDAFDIPLVIHNSGWGFEAAYIRPEEARGAYTWDPPIKTRADIERIQTPTFTYDAEATQKQLESYSALLGDILKVRLHGFYLVYAGLIDEWTSLRGIAQTFWDMVDDPEFVHAGMQRLMEGRLASLESLEAQGLLGLNNGNQYFGSGGLCFTHALPSAGFTGKVRLIDLWGFADAQSMSEVSPAMHEEFVLRYQLPILERFGLNRYGCCEPLHRHLPRLKRLVPRLRRVAVSPWADKRISAEELSGTDIIYSWHPNPAALAAIEFDPEWVRADIRETLHIAKEYGCVLEILLQDTHTCNYQPWRFTEWSRIAMEEVQQAAW